MTLDLKMYKVEKPGDLLDVLRQRHPHSIWIYNQVLKHSEFSDTIQFYTVGKCITHNTWIISDNIRQDYGHYICISAPTPVISGKEGVKTEIVQAFSNSEFINWDDNIMFVGVEKAVSRMVYDISVNHKGNVTEAHPCNFYYMELQDALNINLPCPNDVEIRRLDVTKQEEKFIASTWNYTREGSEADIRQCLQVNPSSGVFIGNKCVAGVFMSGYGSITSLYTLHEHRGKGYGKLAMNFMFRECAKEGCIPSFTVETRNTRSIKFNEGLGVMLVSVVDWIFVKKLDID